MSKYGKRGVSSNKSEVHAAIANLDKGIFPNAFCKVLPDFFGGDEKYCNIIHADGAGTKAILAYLYWKETGDISVFKGIAQDSIVMNLDDLVCIGAVNIPLLLSGTIGRNKFLIPGEVIAEIINGTEEFLQTLRELGIPIYSGGGETADLGDSIRTLVVDNTLTARMLRHDIVLPNIKPGDFIVGLSSTGQASYEKEYNSSMGSNGLTSARHDIFYHKYATKYPEIVDPLMPPDLVYKGNHGVDYKIPNIYWQNQKEYKPVNIGKLVLSPTRTYAPVIKTVLNNVDRARISGIIHCSGGGQTKVMKFVDNVQIIKDNLFPTPPLFQLIQKEAGTSWEEMFQTYNMGHRMEIYVSEESAAEHIIGISKSFNIDAQIIGHVDDYYKQKKLTIIHDGQELTY
ncbi:MAG: AIR synthase related protein [Candidatus Absconditicoccaceae bacterium]